ncbi:hypothetical protein cypCar_00044247 [Cyprinus carpio]|nr:hypothetical protein cypCar_00044247 [Cyprinus carpio]
MPCYMILDRFADTSAECTQVVHSGQIVALFHGNVPQYVWTWLVLTLLNMNIRSRPLLHCCCATALITDAGEQKLQYQQNLINHSELTPDITEHHQNIS